MNGEIKPSTNESEAVALHRTCSAPIAQAMLRYWDIAALLKDLKAEQQLVGEQWDDLLQEMASVKVEEWIEWLHGGEHQKKVRKAWEAKNPRFRMTRRGIEVRPNVPDQATASDTHG